MNSLVYQTFNDFKRNDCLGCFYDSPSQKDHSCLSNLDDNYYIRKSLYYLLTNEYIDQQLYDKYLSDWELLNEYNFRTN